MKVPWLQEAKNGTNHGKMGKSPEKWNQPWQNGEGEVHLATFTWHNKKKYHHRRAIDECAGDVALAEKFET